MHSEFGKWDRLSIGVSPADAAHRAKKGPDTYTHEMPRTSPVTRTMAGRGPVPARSSLGNSPSHPRGNLPSTSKPAGSVEIVPGINLRALENQPLSSPTHRGRTSVRESATRVPPRETCPTPHSQSRAASTSRKPASTSRAASTARSHISHRSTSSRRSASVGPSPYEEDLNASMSSMRLSSGSMALPGPPEPVFQVGYPEAPRPGFCATRRCTPRSGPSSPSPHVFITPTPRLHPPHVSPTPRLPHPTSPPPHVSIHPTSPSTPRLPHPTSPSTHVSPTPQRHTVFEEIARTTGHLFEGTPPATRTVPFTSVSLSGPPRSHSPPSALPPLRNSPVPRQSPAGHGGAHSPSPAPARFVGTSGAAGAAERSPMLHTQPQQRGALAARPLPRGIQGRSRSHRHPNGPGGPRGAKPHLAYSPYTGQARVGRPKNQFAASVVKPITSAGTSVGPFINQVATPQPTHRAFHGSPAQPLAPAPITGTRCHGPPPGRLRLGHPGSASTAGWSAATRRQSLDSARRSTSTTPSRARQGLYGAPAPVVAKIPTSYLWMHVAVVFEVWGSHMNRIRNRIAKGDQIDVRQEAARQRAAARSESRTRQLREAIEHRSARRAPATQRRPLPSSGPSSARNPISSSTTSTRQPRSSRQPTRSTQPPLSPPPRQPVPPRRSSSVVPRSSGTHGAISSRQHRHGLSPPDLHHAAPGLRTVTEHDRPMPVDAAAAAPIVAAPPPVSAPGLSSRQPPGVRQTVAAGGGWRLVDEVLGEDQDEVEKGPVSLDACFLVASSCVRAVSWKSSKEQMMTGHLWLLFVATAYSLDLLPLSSSGGQKTINWKKVARPDSAWDVWQQQQQQPNRQTLQVAADSGIVSSEAFEPDWPAPEPFAPANVPTTINPPSPLSPEALPNPLPASPATTVFVNNPPTDPSYPAVQLTPLLQGPVQPQQSPEGIRTALRNFMEREILDRQRNVVPFLGGALPVPTTRRLDPREALRSLMQEEIAGLQSQQQARQQIWQPPTQPQQQQQLQQQQQQQPPELPASPPSPQAGPTPTQLYMQGFRRAGPALLSQ
ncbi:hypothetical protein PAPYR_6947 [Paratrimastix pyriformis]|uniref:Uncharacterized protein n=1 Tax=Paratrimastix pyriformis TaxID=342808 RepID=A0ABQ8UFN7_9EUKA|nr:hypothetical protein PAPYR_6947 [Paratrimastix pyriformis]